jgi:hypothetical protein
MKNTFLILSVVSALLVSVIYSPSASAVDEVTTDCSYTKDKKTAFCSTSDSEDVYRCDKQKNGTWKCGTISRATSSIPQDLKDAVVDAKTADEPSRNLDNKLNVSDFSPFENKLPSSETTKEHSSSSDEPNEPPVE